MKAFVKETISNIFDKGENKLFSFEHIYYIIFVIIFTIITL